MIQLTVFSIFPFIFYIVFSYVQSLENCHFIQGSREYIQNINLKYKITFQKRANVLRLKFKRSLKFVVQTQSFFQPFLAVKEFHMFKLFGL